ncbi:MAG: hypothetical protein FWC00_02110 [Firmicutes bacterium]|nr:hypothetical protein [Bacillota bacterium]
MEKCIGNCGRGTGLKRAEISLKEFTEKPDYPNKAKHIATTERTITAIKTKMSECSASRGVTCRTIED